MQTSDDPDAISETPGGAASGCLYSVYVVGFSAGLLFLNALLCLTIYSAVPKPGDEQIVARLGQLFFFVTPIFLLIVEWNLLDRLLRLFHRDNS